jgi:predicted PhzF superfamily epimerase YddE/YHI9
MARLKQYQVDAFATRVFEGNPAAVVPLDAWPDDGLLQAISEANNLSETAFFVPSPNGFHLRWFTPAAEVNLCGHATLATAHVLFEILGYRQPVIAFETRGGELLVERQGSLLVMDFPALLPIPCPTPDLLVESLGCQPVETLAAVNYLCVFESEAGVRAIAPDFEKLRRLERQGVIVTASGRDRDFVSRYFAPKLGIPEDPVTGSAHCELTPYWAARLGKNRLSARQVSRRGGDILCELQGDRVKLAGRAVTFMEAEIEIGT